VRAPNDELVLETAVNGRADAIVTFNIRNFREVAGHFAGKVLAPGETWKALEAKR
jgi:predicted nucleic acid-binding protein